MPSAPGRVKMPHNNRVSTGGALHTSSIWKQTIGHDPYGDKAADAEVDALKAKSAEQAKGLLELARHQNLANTAGRVVGGDDFAKKMFLGLKRKKLGRDAVESSAAAVSGDKNKDVADSSSSEDEFIEVVQEEEEKSDNTSEDSAPKKRSSSSKKRKKKSSKKKEKKIC
mmetsp:Transcript_11571/g.16624  ORF Transcript_11571/g.16624 Transcript_11571/m.16624 type:complete len:169 (-) Transcript_11571:320-826(-)